MSRSRRQGDETKRKIETKKEAVEPWKQATFLQVGKFPQKFLELSRAVIRGLRTDFWKDNLQKAHLPYTRVNWILKEHIWRNDDLVETLKAIITVALGDQNSFLPKEK